MQSIVLAGGRGSRLYPATAGSNKHLLMVYDKPLIYYAVTSAILSGATSLHFIVRQEDLAQFRRLFSDGSQWNLRIDFHVQDEPNGIVDAFHVTEGLLNPDAPVSLFLGDNMLYGPGLGQRLFSQASRSEAHVFGVKVPNPQDFGVATLDPKTNKVSRLEEKPRSPSGNLAIPGIYLFPPDVHMMYKQVQPSARGELEIIDLLKLFLEQDRLTLQEMPRGTAWLDMGTPTGMMQASNFVSLIQERQNIFVGSPDEAAWRSGRISTECFEELVNNMPDSSYKKTLKSMINDEQEAIDHK